MSSQWTGGAVSEGEFLFSVFFSTLDNSTVGSNQAGRAHQEAGNHRDLRGSGGGAVVIGDLPESGPDAP